MSQVIRAPDQFGEKLRDAIDRGLNEAGIEARVETEHVRTTRLYRALVTSPQFEHMSHSERQDVVWSILRRSLADDEQFRVSTVLALTPAELGEE